MKALLLLLLCLSVLLSGCITANTAIFKPEPDSGGDWVARILGGYFDFGVGFVVMGLGTIVDPEGAINPGSWYPGYFKTSLFLVIVS